MTSGGPRITTDNLVLCLDAHDAKSYPGEPTANYFEDLGEVTRGEFGQYRNLVPIFETYGLVPYTMTMEIKGNIAGNCYVYMQNGSYTKYSFVGQTVVLTTEYQRFTFSNLTPAGPTAAWTANTPTDHRAMLATYTTYGSGRNPTVRNIQIEKGSYATPYVKRTGGRPDSVNLMIHGNVGTGQSFSDSSTSRHSITAGGSATHTNSRSKFGGGSIYFDGSGDFLKIGSSSEWAFSGDFTVDLWVNPQSTGGGNFVGDYYIGSSSTSPDWQLIYIGGSQAVNFWRGSSRATSSTDSVPRNQWSHVALVRSGSGTNNCKIYINGTLDGQGTFTTTVGRGLNLWVGIDGNEASEPYLGYMDEVRVTQGTALWLSNFTPPKRRARISGAWMNRAAGTDGLAVRSGAAFYGGAATKVAHHSNGQVIEPMSAAIIDCDGTDDWIDTGIILKSTMTFSFWYKSESTTAGRVLNVAAWHASGASRWFELMITDNYATNMLEIWAYGYNTTRNDFLPTTGYPNYPAATLNWRNITISFSNGTGTCYLDGVLQGTDAGAFTDFDGASNHSTFWLGRGRNYHYNNANSYTYKDCQIGQFHVWEKALTAAETKANFNAHRGRYGI
jgi:hypothetical protein